MRPVLIFDGDCRFCRRWINRWQRITGDAVEYVPYQSLADRFPQVTQAQCEQSVVLVEPDGHITTAAAAVFRSLAIQPRWRWTVWLYDRVPGVAAITEWCYRWVARHRSLLSVLAPQPVTTDATRWWFLRLLGVVYLIAYASLWSQVAGLIGSRGILPATALLQQAQQYFGGVNVWQFPTLCWISASDEFLHGLCVAGVGMSLLVVADRLAGPALWGLWVVYLSLTTVGGVFFGYQWDALLLETGLLAALFASGSRTILWLLRWLVFRLMFASGAVKLLSGDAWWQSLRALTIHYETQPLPTWVGWWAHQLPEWFHVAACAAVLGIELGAPFLIFAPRRGRLAGAAVMAGLMGLIALTGNYGFFNLLTVVLCVLLLDDGALPAWARKLARIRPPSWGRWAVVPVALLLFVWSIPPLVGAFRVQVGWPSWLGAPGAWRSVNGYGLFAVMTYPRYEIVIEGSYDGQRWEAYEFRQKPGDVTRRPGFVAPHQPRVDWQMWFAALGQYDQNPWLINLCVRLLQGEPAVAGLLEHNPFAGQPPRHVRAQLYEYRFTDVAMWRATGAWWRRQWKAEYCPVISLRKAGG